MRWALPLALLFGSLLERMAFARAEEDGTSLNENLLWAVG